MNGHVHEHVHPVRLPRVELRSIDVQGEWRRQAGRRIASHKASLERVGGVKGDRGLVIRRDLSPEPSRLEKWRRENVTDPTEFVEPNTVLASLRKESHMGLHGPKSHAPARDENQIVSVTSVGRGRSIASVRQIIRKVELRVEEHLGWPHTEAADLNGLVRWIPKDEYVGIHRCV